MIAFLADQNFDERIVRGLLRKNPTIDIVLARHAGMDRAKDANVLGWAAEQGRLVLTHDGKTMPRHAADRMRRAEPVAGVLIVPTCMPIGEAIDDLLLIAECTETEDWQASVVYLPLDR